MHPFENGLGIESQNCNDLIIKLTEIDMFARQIREELEARNYIDRPTYAIMSKPFRAADGSWTSMWIGSDDFSEAVKIAQKEYPEDKESVGYRVRKIYQHAQKGEQNDI